MADDRSKPLYDDIPPLARALDDSLAAASRATISPDDEALLRSLQMHLTAWESIYAAELAAKNISQDEFTARRESLHKRTAKLTTFLKENTHE